MAFKAKLNHFDLEVLSSVETTLEKNIVEYEVPFADGAILDDLGVKATRIKLRTIWRGGNYDLVHADFMSTVDTDQVSTLIHPELGRVIGRISSATIVHDDRRRCAEISIEFIEDKNPSATPAYNPSLEAALEESLADTIVALCGAQADELAAAGLDPTQEIDPDQPLAGQINARSLSARALIARIDNAILTMRRFNNNVLNRIDSAVGMINYAATLPGTIIGSVAYAVERAAMIAESLGNAPVMFVSSLRGSVARLKASVPMLARTIAITAGNIGALFTGKLFANDEAKKAVVRRIEDTAQWRIDGTPVGIAPVPPVLTANELDESLAQICDMLHDGIDAARDMDCTEAVAQLAKQIDILTRYINEIKLERDRIITVEVEDPTPLHSICLRHGLPYTYADRIVTINNFLNPTFCIGEVKLYGRRG